MIASISKLPSPALGEVEVYPHEPDAEALLGSGKLSSFAVGHSPRGIEIIADGKFFCLIRAEALAGRVGDDLVLLIRQAIIAQEAENTKPRKKR